MRNAPVLQGKQHVLAQRLKTLKLAAYANDFLDEAIYSLDNRIGVLELNPPEQLARTVRDVPASPYIASKTLLKGRSAFRKRCGRDRALLPPDPARNRKPEEARYIPS